MTPRQVMWMYLNMGGCFILLMSGRRIWPCHTGCKSHLFPLYHCHRRGPSSTAAKGTTLQRDERYSPLCPTSSLPQFRTVLPRCQIIGLMVKSKAFFCAQIEEDEQILLWVKNCVCPPSFVQSSWLGISLPEMQMTYTIVLGLPSFVLC